MKKSAIFGLIAALVLVFTAPAVKAASPPITEASSDFLMNITTGEIYYEKNADEARAPASLTKLMTVYLVYEAIAAGNITKDTQVYISRHTQDIALDPEGSNVPLYCGEYYSVDELLCAAMTVSANGAACALGELLSGTEEAFAMEMTSCARFHGWDMTFYDASGLDDRNRATARSMAYLAKTLISKYPDVLSYSAKTSITFRGDTYNATNFLLPGKMYEYSGTDGLKTGTTSAAGRCLIATSVRDGNRLLAVALGAGSNDIRYNDVIKMMDYGYTQTLSLRLSKHMFFINGTNSEIASYIADGKNYIRLRDFSKLLSGTVNEFSVDWDNETNTIIITKEPYISDIALKATPEITGAKRSNANIRIEGNIVCLEGYIINGEHYFPLRDIADLIGAYISYDSEASAVYIIAEAYGAQEAA